MKRPAVSVIVATYNEAENIPKIIPRIHEALNKAKIDEEIIVVDDNSPDSTSGIARRMAKTGKYPVRVIERKKKQGLIQADVDGFSHARADVIGCMDADLSHPPEKLPELIRPILDGNADITVGSKYAGGGGIKNGWPLKRRIMSWVAMTLARPISPVKDSVSGFFFFRHSAIKGIEFRSKGFKTLLEILVKGRYKTTIEVPITFADRARGQSKLGKSEILGYLAHLAQLYKHKALKK